MAVVEVICGGNGKGGDPVTWTEAVALDIGLEADKVVRSDIVLVGVASDPEALDTAPAEGGAGILAEGETEVARSDIDLAAAQVGIAVGGSNWGRIFDISAAMAPLDVEAKVGQSYHRAMRPFAVDRIAVGS